ncbi:hypothetical protein A3Q56_04689 [Intoshia linei]|uniref:Small ribosomal subunit protein uS15 n=1 Tax=Intoshia linei TaxID=1819745 RepID=A0A177B0E1_9BILA|nr:hypothetical protein A3Q56_04689 [Intoshia linei]
MGRMHSNGKGISKRVLPYVKRPPTWNKATPPDVKELVMRLAKMGLAPSQIGVALRDSHAIGSVKRITGSKILRILKMTGLAPKVPEDLHNLMKKAISIRKHMESNRTDSSSKFRLVLVESRIHRLARHYKTKNVLDSNWKYDPQTAVLL